jgi:hypothetical protein
MRFQKLATQATLLAAVTLVGAGASTAPAMAAPRGPGPAGLPTQAVPGLKDCGLGKPEVRPKTLIIACADAGIVAEGLTWSVWGASGASATGIITWNTCVPNCAASKKWGKSTATYKLGDVVHTSKYGWLFEALTVHITGKQTGGMPRVLKYPEKPE